MTWRDILFWGLRFVGVLCFFLTFAIATLTEESSMSNPHPLRQLTSSKQLERSLHFPPKLRVLPHSPQGESAVSVPGRFEGLTWMIKHCLTRP